MVRQINEAGLNLIKSFESCKLKAYRDPVNLWTVGWGHLIKPSENWMITVGEFKQEAVDTILIEDLKIAEHGVESLLQVEVNNNQFAAMVSLAFNIGNKNFAKSSVLSSLNAGRNQLAALAFLKWNRARNSHGQLVELKGLTRRRMAERDLFLKEVS